MLQQVNSNALLRVLLAFVLLVSGLLVSCNDKKGSITPRYIVTFQIASGPTVTPGLVESGQKVAKPEISFIRGSVLSEWYTDLDYTKEFDFNTPITANLTLYAKLNPASSDAKLLSFSFRQADNTFSALAEEDRTVAGVINEDDHTITVTPSVYLHGWSSSSLKASFTASAGSTVRVGNVAQTSGVTANDFSKPLSYEVTSADGTYKQVYQVAVGTTSQLADIPDLVFRAYLKAKFPSAFEGERLKIDDSSVTGYNGALGNGGFNGQVTSLKGLEFFTAVTVLEASDNALTTLDVSQNTALTKLTLNNNKLTALDVTKNIALTTLYVANNKLTALDVSNNPAIAMLTLNDNQLTTLDVSNNPALTELNISKNQIAVLDLSTSPRINSLVANDNKFTMLDFSKNLLLTGAYFYNTDLVSLDWRGLRDPNVVTLPINDRTPNLTTFKLHEIMKNRTEIKDLKKNRGANITISLWSAADGSTDYTLVCADYDPNANSGAGACSTTTTNATP